MPAARISAKGRDRTLPCVADAPDGFHTQILTIITAAVSTRLCHQRHPGEPAGPSGVGSGSGSGVTSRRGHSEHSCRAIAGAERIASPGVTPTASAPIQTAQLGRLSMACCPPSYRPDGISHAWLKNLLPSVSPCVGQGYAMIA